MKRFLRKIKDFFIPPASASIQRKVLPYVFLGAVTVVVLIASAFTWDYTNSPQFCGETCHTMPPEYTAYLTSPHARIDCVDCHIGKDFIATRITRKAGDFKHVTALLFKDYEFPIRAKELRPARETCEKCHFPEKFSDDSLRQEVHFGDDAANSPTTTYLILKTGGGSKRVGLGKGIHWHIENPVYYYPTDSEEQDIPYIRVQNEDGSVTEYVDVQANFDPASITDADLKEMDCITCHNRITHLVKQPEDIIDQLLSLGVISKDIPEIRRLGVEQMRRPYTTLEEAKLGIAGIEDYYKTYYADYYQSNSEGIQTAISTLQQAYSDSVFPEQKSDWDSHPNNIGHLYSPGCFRCHDGKHLDANQQAIRLECNLCHSIPVVAGTEDFVADIEISRGPEPSSHLNPNWISLHHSVYDQSCTGCHNTADPGGTSNTSFCSNSACHGSSWKYAGFDAPALREIIQAQLPTPTPAPTEAPQISAGETPTNTGPITYDSQIGEIFNAKCSTCHGETGTLGLTLTTYAGAMQGSTNGPVIVPGDPDSSLLVEKQSGQKPHFGQLSPEELDTVMQWIESGAIEK
jgi:nitrate/TMAO reductase-like tetraheme cytochrome c subunit